MLVYLLIISALMLLLPAGSCIAEALLRGAPLSIALAAKWFVFWSVGVRLLSAGAKQIWQPEYTARAILKLKSDDALLVIRELGFANVAMGSLGMASLVFSAWRPAGALVGGVFYGLAAVNHIMQAHRGRLENIAMVSDAFAAVVLLSSFADLIR
jgi:hypothetical protein